MTMLRGNIIRFLSMIGLSVLTELVDEISHATSLTASDVRAVTWELIEVFRRYLARGNKVRLDGIGIFKLSF